MTDRARRKAVAQERSDLSRLRKSPSIEAAVCIGTDAFRIALGLPTRNYEPHEVIMWLKAMMSAKVSAAGETEKKAKE